MASYGNIWQRVQSFQIPRQTAGSLSLALSCKICKADPWPISLESPGLQLVFTITIFHHLWPMLNILNMLNMYKYVNFCSGSRKVTRCSTLQLWFCSNFLKCWVRSALKCLCENAIKTWKVKGAFSLLKRALVPRCTRKNPKQLLCWSIARQRLHSFTFQPWFQSKSHHFLSKIFLQRVPHVRIAVSVSISGGGPERALQICCFHCRRAHIGQGPKFSTYLDNFGHTWSILKHLAAFNII